MSSGQLRALVRLRELRVDPPARDRVERERLVELRDVVERDRLAERPERDEVTR